MSNTFDEFLDDDGFEPDEAEDDFDDAPQTVRVALMNKGDVIALIGVVTSQNGGVITRVDPRAEPPIATSRCDTSQIAERMFSKSLRTSVRNGWQVFYDGVPLEG